MDVSGSIPLLVNGSPYNIDFSFLGQNTKTTCQKGPFAMTLYLFIRAAATIVSLLALARVFTHRKEVTILSLLWNLVAVLLWIIVDMDH